MVGKWVILLWSMIAVVFLAKNTSVMNFFKKLRKMSAVVILCVALCFLHFAEVSYTKDGLNRNQAVSQTSMPAAAKLTEAAPSSRNSSFILQRSALSSGMPAWWNDDDTDSDADGIPDLWEKWTHGNRQVADGTIDRDDDGLTDLEEFQNQTDPRTADTDGDGFNDSFEVANGMNPVSAEDFTPTEPDADHNGRIDLWENAPCYYGFTDNDHDGFDDYYEGEVLETASEANFDVVVTVYTTRSAVLTWDGGANGIVVLPTTGQAIRLRLPFNADTELKLMASPEGISSPEAGGLWKACFTVAFAPRSGQVARGSVIIASNGDISQKVVDTERTITRFPEEEESMQTLSLGVGDGASTVPKITLVYRRLGIEPVYPAWHFVGEPIGTFAVTNYAGSMPESNAWSAEHGSVSPDVGMTTFLTVASAPSEYESVAIIAVSELDANTVVTNRLPIPKCNRGEFGVDSGTDNFSPHLGETASFTLGLTGCTHDTPDGWLEAEVMRETTAGWQHVGWLDMMPSESGHQKRRQCLEGPQTIDWDGIATEGAAPADSPAVFTNGKSPFHRALPEVVSGEPVPPPYYTLFFRYREENSDSAAILDESWFKVYVPQVVKVEMTDAAYSEFTKPIVYPDTYWSYLISSAVTNCVFYSGTNGTTKTTVLGDVLTKSQRRIPNTVNLIFTTNAVSGRHKTVSITTIGNYRETWMRGQHDGSVSWCNSSPSGGANIYADSIAYWTAEALILHLSGVPHDESLCLGKHLPFTYDGLCESFAGTVVHETGHTLGLVNKTFLYGSSGNHNSNPQDVWIMNSGGIVEDVYRFGVSGKFPTWKTRNLLYLQFILPTPVEQ